MENNDKKVNVLDVLFNDKILVGMSKELRWKMMLCIQSMKEGDDVDEIIEEFVKQNDI